jgi:uncharacterized protein YaaN involved in tellurite resistance
MTSTALAATTADSALAVLSPERRADEPVERQKIDQIKQSIDITSSTSVINFGTASEQRVADFADSVLDQVMSKDLGPVHEQLSEMKSIANGLDTSRLQEQKGFFSRLFFNIKKEIENFSDRFNSARGQIDAIANRLEDQIQDVNLGLIMLDKLFDQNLDNFRELTLHIEAGKELLAHYRDVELPRLDKEAQAKSDDPDALLHAQRVRDLKAGVERLDRKIMNLEKSKAIAHASMPTIRQVQQTGIMLVEELRTALAHAIPAWKNTMLIHIEQLKQKHGLKTLQAMSDFTNAQLKAMADQLDQNTVEIHEQSQRGIADVEAITYTINSLIGTLDKVDQLEAQAREARTHGRAELAKAEAELRAQQARID